MSISPGPGAFMCGVVPIPRFHSQRMISEYMPPVPLAGTIELSVKFTHNFSQPSVSETVNEAIGGGLI